MILEGLMTTNNADGTPNISPMGPIVNAGAEQGGPLSELVLRPFQTSTTYANLKRTGEGVFHVTDDVLMIARAAVGRLAPPPPLHQIEGVATPILSGACRWYAVRVTELDDTAERTTVRAAVVASGRQRDFFGLNRAMHAVVEGAILATRLHLLDPDDVRRQFEALQVIVNKTAGPREHKAFEFLLHFLNHESQESHKSHKSHK